jgi:hypothetical protein
VGFSFKVVQKLKRSCHYNLVDAALKPYRYACHFADIVPTHLPPNAKVGGFGNDDDPGARVIQAENLPILRSGELKAMRVPAKSFPVRSLRETYFGFGVSHRSGIFGTSQLLGNVDGGSNFVYSYIESKI